MALPAEAIALIQRFEGCLKRIPDGRLAPYLCPARVPTVGWGTTRYPEGTRVALADTPITQQRADECLEWELRDNERSFDALTTRIVPALSRGAIVSFIYNCGNGAYRGSTLRKRINDALWADVPKELAKWRMGGGRVLAGLVRRRAEEAALFMKGIKGAAVDAEVVRPLPAPAPQPTAGLPQLKTRRPEPARPGWVSTLIRMTLGWR